MNQLTIPQAVEILKQYSCTTIKNPSNLAEKEELKHSILLVSNVSDYQNLGICADTLELGFNALASYLVALGYDHQLSLPQESSNKPVYIKFNTQKLNYYLDEYEGDYRGVLISYQGDDWDVMGTYGYFPLDLFD
jgi:hypothetical protein